MTDHCDNCYCDTAITYLGLRRKIYLKVVFAFGTLSYFVMGTVMSVYFHRTGFSGMTVVEKGLFIGSIVMLSFCFLLVIFTETYMYFEFLWSFICGCYAYMCDGLNYIRDHARLPVWQDIRVMLSTRGARARVRPQQEVSASDGESDEERPPLPPKRRKVTEAAERVPFQKLTSDLSQEASSSNAPVDESEGSISSILQRPHCSTQSPSSLRTSGRRGKKLSKRELFRNMMLEAISLNPIHEEDLNQQEASGVNVPLSLLTQNSASGDETEQESSFTIEPQQTETTVQERALNVDENYEHTLSQGVSGRQVQERTLGTRKKQKGRGQTSSIIQSTEKEQWSGSKDSETKRSPEKISPAKYVSFSELQIPSQTSENEGVERTESSKISFSSSGNVQRVSHIESSKVQTSESYISLPQLENQSREFGIRIEKRSNPEQQTESYVPLSSLENPVQEQSLMSGFCSQEARTSNITYPENQSQASASYVGLPELERQSRKFGTKTQDIQSISEMTSRYVPFSALESLSQEKTSSRISTDSQGQVWAPSIQHQSSGSFTELPKREKQSSEYDTGVGEGMQRSPEQNPLSRNISVSPSVSQSQKQTSAARLLSFDIKPQSSDVQISQEGKNQAAASYVGLPEFEKQSKELGLRTVKDQNSPEHQSMQSYVPISPEFQVSGMHGVQRMQPNIEQTSLTGASDLMRQIRTPDVQRRRSSRKTPPYYPRFSESERQSRENNLPYSCTSSDVELPIPQSKFQTFTSQRRASQGEIFEPRRESETPGILEKLRNLEQASVVGFPKVSSQSGNFRESQELTPSVNYSERILTGESERCFSQRPGTLSIMPERSMRGSGSRTMKSTGGSTERTGYAPYPVLSKSERNPPEEPVVIAPLQRRKSAEGQIRRRSPTDPLFLEEPDKYETQKKETILSLNLATGGLVLSQEGAEGDETAADSSEMSYMYDQPIDILDLSHIEVPVPTPKEATKEHKKE